MQVILTTAYAINPYKGSEDGTAWNLVQQIARYNKVIVITRENNQADIEKYIAENPDCRVLFDKIQFLYYDLPYWARFWKKGSRGAMLYYYLWQLFMPFFIRKQKVHFDIVHNLNFHNDWTPSLLWTLDKPMVWGPIGHHPPIPKNYFQAIHGKNAYFIDRLKSYIKKFFWKFDPLLKQTIAKSDAIIAINSSVKKVINVPSDKLHIMPAVASEKVEKVQPKNSNKFNILSIGRFVPLKGFDISLRAFAQFYHQLPKKQQAQVQLTIVGKGPQKKQLVQLAEDLKITKKVNFIEWIAREKLVDIYQNAHAFLFPSHEGAGMVIPEALSYALPVLCFDNYGPGEFVDDTCSLKVPYTTYKESVQHFAQHLQKLHSNPLLYVMLAEGARKQYLHKFDWELKGETLKQIYDKVGTQHLIHYVNTVLQYEVSKF